MQERLGEQGTGNGASAARRQETLAGTGGVVVKQRAHPRVLQQAHVRVESFLERSFSFSIHMTAEIIVGIKIPNHGHGGFFVKHCEKSGIFHSPQRLQARWNARRLYCKTNLLSLVRLW